VTVAPTRMRRLGAMAAVATIAAGCLGDGAPASVAPSPTRVPEPTPVTTTYDVGGTVWYEGLVLHIDRVTAVLDARGGPVEVALRVDNPNVDAAEIQATIFLQVGGVPIRPTRESRIPPIPADGQVSSVMTYELQGVTSVDEASVQVGEGPNHAAFIPLTPAGGPTVTLEPQALVLTGTGTADDLRITLREGLQRWDLPDWSQELPVDRQVILVTFDATFEGGFTGGFPFNAASNVALRLPDGTDVSPRADGHYRPVELIGPGRTKRNLTTRFEIPASVTGELSFVVLAGDEEKLIPLVIPG
jgi:hypothetical protein